MINHCVLIGHLGQEPTATITAGGNHITNFSLATSERFKDKSGKHSDKVEWHKIVIFGKLAENTTPYLNKGSRVYIEGRIQTRKWKDKDGLDRYTTEIIATKIQFLSPRSTSTSTSPSAPAPPAADDDLPF